MRYLVSLPFLAAAAGVLAAPLEQGLPLDSGLELYSTATLDQPSDATFQLDSRADDRPADTRQHTHCLAYESDDGFKHIIEAPESGVMDKCIATQSGKTYGRSPTITGANVPKGWDCSFFETKECVNPDVWVGWAGDDSYHPTKKPFKYYQCKKTN